MTPAPERPDVDAIAEKLDTWVPPITRADIAALLAWIEHLEAHAAPLWSETPTEIPKEYQ